MFSYINHKYEQNMDNVFTSYMSHKKKQKTKNKSRKNTNIKVLFKDHIHVQYKENNRSFNLLPFKFNNK